MTAFNGVQIDTIDHDEYWHDFNNRKVGPHLIVPNTDYILSLILNRGEDKKNFAARYHVLAGLAKPVRVPLPARIFFPFLPPKDHTVEIFTGDRGVNGEPDLRSSIDNSGEMYEISPKDGGQRRVPVGYLMEKTIRLGDGDLPSSQIAPVPGIEVETAWLPDTPTPALMHA